MDDFTIKEIEKSNFNQAKQLILNCLLEQGYWVFRFLVLKSSQIQVCELRLLVKNVNMLLSNSECYSS